MAKHQFQKHFTLDEARARLPFLRKTFQSIQRNKAAMEEAEVILKKTHEQTGGDLGGALVESFLESLAAVRDGLLAIAQQGIQIKDIDRGLVDFPSLRDGREVFLCWELDEDDIEFWHDLDAGYAGRERL